MHDAIINDQYQTTDQRIPSINLLVRPLFKHLSATRTEGRGQYHNSFRKGSSATASRTRSTRTGPSIQWSKVGQNDWRVALAIAKSIDSYIPCVCSYKHQTSCVSRTVCNIYADVHALRYIACMPNRPVRCQWPRPEQRHTRTRARLDRSSSKNSLVQ